MTLVLDAGAFLAAERGNRDLAALVKGEWLGGRRPVTHGGVVAQVWRGGAGRQARIARLLAGTEVIPLDEALGRRAGVLLGRARAVDVVDAALVCLAVDGDDIVTSDAADLVPLAEMAGVHVDIIEL